MNFLFLTILILGPQINTCHRLEIQWKCNIRAPQAAWLYLHSQRGSVAVDKACSWC